MTDIFLYPGDATPTNVILSDPTVQRTGSSVSIIATTDAADIAAISTTVTTSAGIAATDAADIAALIVGGALTEPTVIQSVVAESNSSGTPLAYTFSSAPQLNDLLLIFYSTDGGSSAATISGWSNGAGVFGWGNDVQGLGIMYRWATASESSSFSFPNTDFPTGDSDVSTVMSVVRSVDTTTPFDVTATTNSNSTASAWPLTITGVGLASGSANRLLMLAYSSDNSNGSDIVSNAAPTASVGSNSWALNGDGTGSGASGWSSIGVASVVDVAGTYTTGPSAVQSLTSGANSNCGSATILIALRGLTGGGSTNAAIASVDGADIASISVANWTTSQVVATDGQDIAPISATVTTGSAIAGIDANDVAAIVAANWTTSQIAPVDGADIVAISASSSSITSAIIAALDAADITAIIAANWTTSQIAALDAADIASILTSVTTGATISTIDAPDIASIIAANWTTAQISSVDAPDIAAINANSGGITVATIATLDAADIAAILAANWTTAGISALDAADIASIATAVTTGATIAIMDGADVVGILIPNQASPTGDDWLYVRKHYRR